MTKEKIKSIFDKLKGAFFAYEQRFYSIFLFTTLRDIRFKMNRYVDLVVNGNMKAIKRFKIHVPKRILSTIIDTLMLEYAELSNSKEVNERVALNDKFNNMVLRHKVLSLCGTLLVFDPENEDVLAFLNKSNIKGEDIKKKVVSEMKTIELKLEELKASIPKQKDSKGKKLSIEYYSDTFTVLRESGFAADWDMPVVDFISAMKAFKKKVEDNNKQVEELKRKKR